MKKSTSILVALSVVVWFVGVLYASYRYGKAVETNALEDHVALVDAQTLGLIAICVTFVVLLVVSFGVFRIGVYVARRIRRRAKQRPA